MEEQAEVRPETEPREQAQEDTSGSPILTILHRLLRKILLMPLISVLTQPQLWNSPERMPTIWTTLAGQTVANHSAVHASSNRTPNFTGLTTIANAVIDLQVHGGTAIYIATTANANGYWHWTPASDLALGGYVIYLTATNPVYFGQLATNAFGFEIVEEDDDEEDENEELSSADPAASSELTGIGISGVEQLEIEKTGKPFDFSVELKSQDLPMRSGDELEMKIIVGEVDPAYQDAQAAINFSIVDPLGNELVKDMHSIILANGLRSSLILAVPCTENEGRHLARVQISFGSVHIDREIPVRIENGVECQKQQPANAVLNTTLVGSKNPMLISFVDWMGWLVVVLIIILLLLILMFIYLTRERDGGNDPKMSRS